MTTFAYFSIWSQSYTCDTAPSTIYSINQNEMNVPAAYSLNSWSFGANNDNTNFCSWAQIAANAINCCVSLYQVNEYNAESGTPNNPLVNSTSMVGVFTYTRSPQDFAFAQPPAANGKNYCYLNYTGSADTIERWQLDNGECIDGTSKCLNGVFTFYDGQGCQSAPLESYNSTVFNLPTWSNVLAANVTSNHVVLGQGNQVTTWIGYYWALAGTDFNSPIRAFCLFIIIIGLVLGYFGVGWYCYKMYQQVTFFHFGSLMSILLIAFDNNVRVALMVTDQLSYSVTLNRFLRSFANLLGGFGLLLLQCLNVSVLRTVMPKFVLWNATWKIVLVYFCLFGLEFVGLFANFLDVVCYPKFVNGSLDSSWCPVEWFSSKWIFMMSYDVYLTWVIFSDLLNNGIIAFLVIYIAILQFRASKTAKEVSVALIYEKFLLIAIIFAGCIVNLIVYVTMRYGLYFTIWYYSDFNSQAILLVTEISFAFSFFLKICSLEIKRRQATTRTVTQGAFGLGSTAMGTRLLGMPKTGTSTKQSAGQSSVSKL